MIQIIEYVGVRNRSNRVKFRGGKRRKNTQYMMEEVKEWVKRKLAYEEQPNETLSMQVINNNLEKTLNEASNIFGKKKEKENTDDKITKKTKGLIKRRGELRNKPILTELEKIELAEIRKLVRREIKNDCRIFDEQKTEEIIKETWSTRKWRTDVRE